MILSFKTELNLNDQQKTLCAKHAGVARHAYNWGLSLTKFILDYNKANPDDKLKFPSAIELHKLLVALCKSRNRWYYEVSKCAPQFALRNLREAWKRCLSRVSKPPRFKKKGRNDSFTLDGSIKIDHFHVKLPQIGWVRTFERLPQGVNPKTITISRTADRWFVSFKIEVEVKNTPKAHDLVGVDLGVKTLATLSTGEVFEGAKSYRKSEAKLSRLQSLNRHQEIGSKNWKKAQRKIARLHRKIANIRKDVLHKLTTYLAKNHSKIVIEDLNVKGMLANHKLAKAIADMGFYEFRRQLEYKCQLYGSQLIIADRWFPSSKTCSNCGTVKEKLSLSERTFQCESCGFSCDRDLNASKNLAFAGSSLV
jgi:putative transposase